MRVVYNVDNPVGSRITKAVLLSQTGVESPIDPCALYDVATTDYLGDGGGGSLAALC